MKPARESTVPGRKELLHLQQLIIDLPTTPDDFDVRLGVERGKSGPPLVVIAVRNGAGTQVMKVTPMRNSRYRVLEYTPRHCAYFDLSTPDAMLQRIEVCIDRATRD